MICRICLSILVFTSLHAGVEEFPAFGISVKVPRGWESVQPGSGGQIARWAKLTNAGTKAKDVVVLELAELRDGLSPYAYAKAVSKKHDGEINREVTMGSLPAIEVRTQRHTEMMTPRQTRVVATKGHLWILSYWAVGKGSLALKTINSMAKSVQFKKFGAPAEHIVLGTKKSSFLKGRLKAQVPTIGRPQIVANAARAQANGVRHFGRRKLEFLFKVQLPEGEQPESFALAKAAFAQRIRQEFQSPTLKFQDFDIAGAEGSLLDPVVLPKEPGKPEFREHHFVLLYKKKELTVVSFMISATDENARRSYQKLIKQILRSVELP
ncbi:MAG: hypothetical protein QGF00_03300 [Planctomycetota bacterium]|nr:hypothetical protein [Planctomycetota bacterium]